MDKLLARGARSEVFLAVELGELAGERHVIVKRLRQSAAQDAVSRHRFLERSRIALALSHPNLVRALESGAEGGVVYLALEYVRGGSLAAGLQYGAAARRLMSVDLALWVGRAVAAALEHVHGACDVRGMPLGLRHGAVSPGNVLLGFDGIVKLADFGIASVALGENEPSRAADVHPAYQAPEQVAGGSVDARADLFGLGVVLHEMLTGRPLFRGKNDLDTMTRLCEGRIPSPRELRRDCPEEVARVVMKALQRDPAERYRSAGAMLAELEAAAQGAGGLLAMRREVNALFEREDRGDPTIPKVKTEAGPAAAGPAAPVAGRAGSVAGGLAAGSGTEWQRELEAATERVEPSPEAKAAPEEHRKPVRFDSDWQTKPVAAMPGRLALPLPAPEDTRRSRMPSRPRARAEADIVPLTRKRGASVPAPTPLAGAHAAWPQAARLRPQADLIVKPELPARGETQTASAHRGATPRGERRTPSAERSGAGASAGASAGAAAPLADSFAVGRSRHATAVREAAILRAAAREGKPQVRSRPAPRPANVQSSGAPSPASVPARRLAPDGSLRLPRATEDGRLRSADGAIHSADGAMRTAAGSDPGPAPFDWRNVTPPRPGINPGPTAPAPQQLDEAVRLTPSMGRLRWYLLAALLAATLGILLARHFT
ncbi:MAG: protein kinase [Deltaproteobacteria bacterium]|nr:protein kinase [Deltaproteobacteria bacterium]